MRTLAPSRVVERLLAEASDQTGRPRQIVVERSPFGWEVSEHTDGSGGILAEHASYLAAVQAALDFLIENIGHGEVGPITITMGRPE